MIVGGVEVDLPAAAMAVAVLEAGRAPFGPMVKVMEKGA